MRTRSLRNAGFTLMELMLAMALFSLLSVGLVTLLSRATGLLAQGNSGVDTLDKLQLFSETSRRTPQPSTPSGTPTPDVRTSASTRTTRRAVLTPPTTRSPRASSASSSYA